MGTVMLEDGSVFYSRVLPSLPDDLGLYRTRRVVVMPRVLLDFFL